MIDRKKYYSKKEMNKDSDKMAKKGWKVHSVESKRESPCCLFGLLFRVTVYYVTYIKE